MAVLNSGPPSERLRGRRRMRTCWERAPVKADRRLPQPRSLLSGSRRRLGRPFRCKRRSTGDELACYYGEAIRPRALDRLLPAEAAPFSGSGPVRTRPSRRRLEPRSTIEPPLRARAATWMLSLSSLGRRAEARASLEALEQTRNLLREERFDSGYALDLAAHPGPAPRREEGGPTGVPRPTETRAPPASISGQARIPNLYWPFAKWLSSLGMRLFLAA